MSKTIIEVKCVDQVMTFVNTPVIASGGMGEDYVSFEFCEKWDGYTVTALFWRQGVDPIPVLADAENLYQVPPELMTSEGVVYFGVAGVDADGARRTSEAISYRIQAGAITENTTLPDPDGDVFTQLLAQYADIKLYVASSVSQASEAASSAEASATAATAAAEQAAIDAKEAVGAVDAVIYPGVVQCVMKENTSHFIVPLSKKPTDKMFLTFRLPFNGGNFITYNYMYMTYPDENGEETSVLVPVRDAYSSTAAEGSIKNGDIVTVLLWYGSESIGGENKYNAYLLNTRITGYVHEKLGAKAETVTYSATVSESDWTESNGYYYQDITVDGILSTDDPIFGIDPVDDNSMNVTNFGNAGKIFRITTSDGSVRLWAKSEITTALPIRLKVVR